MRRISIFILFLFCFLLILIQSFHFNWACDDAYISLVYAKNLAWGNGLVYNLGEKIEGFSNFLWVVILASAIKIGFSVVFVAKLLGLIFSFLTIIVTYQLAKKIAKEDSLALLSVLLLSSSGVFTLWVFSGLETIFFTFLLTWGIYLSLNEGKKSALFFCSIVLILTTLTRPEGALIFLLVYKVRTGKASGIAYLILPYLMALISFELFRLLYFKELLPNSFYVKVGATNFSIWFNGFKYVLRFFTNFGGLFLFVLIFLFYLVEGKYKEKNFNYLTLIICSWLFYLIYIGGDFMPYFRFITPILPLLCILLSFSLLSLCQRINLEGRFIPPWNSLIKFILLAVVVIAILLKSFSGADHKTALGWREYDEFKMEVGKWLKQNAQKEDKIAVNPAGIVSFYSELYSIDMLGLNNKLIAKSGKRDFTQAMGHQKGEGNFVLSLRPTYIFLGALSTDDYFQKEPKPPYAEAVFLGDKQILSNPEFEENYELLTIPLENPRFKSFKVFKRK